MSANNWTTCPRCRECRDIEIRAASAALEAMYGKVPVDVYEANVKRIVELRESRLRETFMEYYEFHGAASGTVTADYGGSCEVCGLTARLKHSVTFYPEPT